MRPLGREAIIERIERLESLDPIAERIQSVVRALVPEESERKDLLSGTWLGHPLHPMLTDVVIGAWTSAFFLDLVPRKEAHRAAERLIGIGVVSAVPTALAGLSDWAELSGPPRRVGSVHAIGNSTSLGLYAASWLVRRRGRQGAGIALATAGSAVATFSAWLGGHLSFGLGVGVNQAAFEDAPADWTPVLDETDLLENTLIPARADGVGILLVRRGADTYALADRCSHRGCALHEGELNADEIACPCHGSTFRLDGSLVKGPATSPQPVFEVRTHEGRVEIRVPPS